VKPAVVERYTLYFRVAPVQLAVPSLQARFKPQAAVPPLVTLVSPAKAGGSVQFPVATALVHELAAGDSQVAMVRTT